MLLREAIQPEVLVQKLVVASKSQPQPGPTEGDVVVRAGNITVEAGNAIRFCFMTPVTVVSGQLPAKIPNDVEFAENVKWNGQLYDAQELDIGIHYNGTTKITSISPAKKREAVPA